MSVKNVGITHSDRNSFGKKHWSRICYTVLFIGFLGILIYKCRFGYAHADESLYLTIPYRLWQGDALFRDIWDPTMLSAIPELPFMMLYKRFFPTNDGILLNFRYIHLFCQVAISLFVFLGLRKKDETAAMIASLCVFLFTPCGIMALSYNTMGLMFHLAMCLFLSPDEDVNRITIKKILAGVSLANAVLCCPFILYAYAVYSAIVIGSFILNKWKKKSINIWYCDTYTWSGLTIGAALTAAVVLIWLFSKISPKEVLRLLPIVIPQDKGFSLRVALNPKNMIIIQGMGRYFRAIWNSSNGYPKALLSYAVLLLLYKLDRSREKHQSLFFIAGAGVFFYMLSYYLTVNRHINHVTYAINYFGLFCFFMIKNKKRVKTAFLFWIVGFIYSICINFSSVEGLPSICAAMSVSMTGSILILHALYREVFESASISIRNKRITAITWALVMLVQVGSLLYVRYITVWFEPFGMKAQTVMITDGPDKGILTTLEKKGSYDLLLRNVKFLETRPNTNSILMVPLEPTAYLMSEKLRAKTGYTWLKEIILAEAASFESYLAETNNYPDAVYTYESKIPYISHLFPPETYKPYEVEGDMFWLIR